MGAGVFVDGKLIVGVLLGAGGLVLWQKWKAKN